MGNGFTALLNNLPPLSDPASVSVPEFQNDGGRQSIEQQSDKDIVEPMLKQGADQDVSDYLTAISESVNAINGVLGGIESDDIDIAVDPQTGRLRMSVRPKRDEGEGGIADDLGVAENIYMVYQRKEDFEGAQVYGFDYVRGVASTEE